MGAGMTFTLCCWKCARDFTAKTLRDAHLFIGSRHGIECHACAEKRAAEWSRKKYREYMTFRTSQGSDQTVALIWLKNYRWTALFDWDIDRKLKRKSRIVQKNFPNGISQFDFMRVHIK